MKKITFLFLFLTLGVGFFTINSIGLVAEGAAKVFEVDDVLPATTQLRISWTDEYDIFSVHSIKMEASSTKTDASGYALYILSDTYKVFGISVGYEDGPDNYVFYPPYSTQFYLDIDTSTLSVSQRTVSIANSDFYWQDMYVEPQGYSVTFDENGGSTQSDLTDQTQLPTPLPIPTRSGYTFLGWYYDSLFTEEATAGDELEGNVTLYAKWELNTYTITYNTNGGSSVSQTSNVTQLPDPLPLTTKSGFTFLGWYLDQTFQTQAVAGATISSDVTLYAKWDLADTIWFIDSLESLAQTHPGEDASVYWSIVFKSGGETFNLLYIEYFESGITYLEYHTAIGTTLVVCVLDGEDILYFDELYAYIEIIDGNETSSLSLIELLELIATLQTPTQNYTLSFVSNGGTSYSDRYIDNRMPQLPIPTRVNSHFTGWYYDEELSQKANFNDLITDDIVLYAGWILNPIYEDLTEARFSEGYSMGFDEGYSEGIDDGHDDGFSEGYSEGFDDGYDGGLLEGAGSVWNEAYEEGYRDALEIADADIKEAWNEGYEFAKEGFGFQKDGKYYDGKSAYMLGYNDNDNLRKLFIPALVIIFVAIIVLSGINVFRRKE